MRTCGHVFHGIVCDMQPEHGGESHSGIDVNGVRKWAHMIEDAEKTKEIAVAAYETFMLMMTALQTRLDITSAKNYMSIQLHGMVAPFDRAEINFMRVGGKSPREIQKDLHHISVGVLDMIEHIAKGEVTVDDENRESLLTFVRETRNKLPPMQYGE